MNITTDKITIILENQDDINTFWNVISFALDLDAKEHSMTDAERKMANTLCDVTKWGY